MKAILFIFMVLVQVGANERRLFLLHLLLKRTHHGDVVPSSLSNMHTSSFLHLDLSAIMNTLELYWIFVDHR